MKNLFSKKLYLQGLRKIRTIGIAMAIVLIALNALFPIVSILGSQFSYNPNQTVYVVEAAFVAPCSVIVLLFAPIMVYSMFSYLNDRKSSDFYHSLPQKRICVFISFILAIFTWIFGVLLASAFLNAILWAIAVYYTVSVSAIILSFLTYLIAALVLCGFMILAMTVTGTTISNILVFLLFALFVRAFGLFFLYGLYEVAPMFHVANSWLHIFDIDFFLPLSLLEECFNMESLIFYDAEVLVYWAVVSLLLFVASAYFYHFRRSESAGKSAPNRLMQHLYRIAVTFPFMMLTMYMILLEDGVEDFHLILAVIAFLVWVLYELMTTKKIKNVLKSLPLFLIPVVLSLFYVGGIYVGRAIVYETTPERDEIVAVKREGGNFRASTTWENAVLYNDFTTDPQVLDMIAQAVSDTKMTDTWDSSERYDHGYQYQGAYTLQLKSGRKVTYNLVTKNSLRTAFQNAKDLKRVIYSLPADDMIGYIGVYSLPDDCIDEIWSAFAEDFYDMDENKRIEYLKWNEKNNSMTEIHLSGEYKNIDFFIEYDLDLKYTPKALKAFLQYSQKSNPPIDGLKKIKYAINQIENIEGHYASMHIFQNPMEYQDVYTSDIRVIREFLNLLSLDSHLVDFENATKFYELRIALDPKYEAIPIDYDVEKNYGTTSMIAVESFYSINEIYYVTFSEEDIALYREILQKYQAD